MIAQDSRKKKIHTHLNRKVKTLFLLTNATACNNNKPQLLHISLKRKALESNKRRLVHLADSFALFSSATKVANMQSYFCKTSTGRLNLLKSILRGPRLGFLQLPSNYQHSPLSFWMLLSTSLPDRVPKLANNSLYIHSAHPNYWWLPNPTHLPICYNAFSRTHHGPAISALWNLSEVSMLKL